MPRKPPILPRPLSWPPLLSLDEPTPSEVARLWLDEANRLEGYRAGRVQGIPADEVFRRAISELS